MDFLGNLKNLRKLSPISEPKRVMDLEKYIEGYSSGRQFSFELFLLQ